jgi:hypothetical protein
MEFLQKVNFAVTFIDLGTRSRTVLNTHCTIRLQLCSRPMTRGKAANLSHQVMLSVSVLRLLVTANVPSSLILVTLIMFLRNVEYKKSHTAYHPRRRYSSVPNLFPVYNRRTDRLYQLGLRGAPENSERG